MLIEKHIDSSVFSLKSNLDKYESSVSFLSKRITIESPRVHNTFQYINQEERHLIDEWLSAIDSIKSYTSTDKLLLNNLESNTKFYNLLSERCDKPAWQDLLSQIDNVLSEYQFDYKQNTVLHQTPKMADPAILSIINLLYLIPAFNTHRPQLDIDADTGFFTATFETNAHGIFSVLITDKNEIHCSWIEDGYKIVKFNGSFKVRDKRDFLKFKKILSIL